jgi:CubicO group peptidase (beta-lactamase class C family)
VEDLVVLLCPVVAESRRPALTAAALALLLAVSLPPVAASAEAPFPEVDPESVGMSSAALAELAAVVDDYVDREMVVGAELLVVKDRQTVLHEAFGMRDREADLPMERDTLFNIRSMTKPVTGAAVQALIDDGTLQLDDRASDFLPGFDSDAAGEITVEQLLKHRSGLPLTTLQSVDQYESLNEMANAIGQIGPEFEPDSKFWYSDSGADVLGAIVDEASGSSLDAFVGERLLKPLGMTDSFYSGDPDDPHLDRVASLYAGRTGEWTRFWGPEAGPFYPYAWGSQSLYSTPTDYARFLAMWLDDGRVGDEQVLSPEAVARTLTPVDPMGSLGSDAPYPTQYSDTTVYHGQMALMHLLDDPDTGAPALGAEPAIVGYSGSDGTIAWAWPERDLMILYFTQSRGGVTPIRLEAEIERLLLDPASGPAAEIPVAYGDYLGTYTANFGSFSDEPFEVIWRDGDLALDIPSAFIFVLDRVDSDEERWALRDAPGAEISFTRDEGGAVSGLRFSQGGQDFDLPKGAPEIAAEETLRPEDVAMYLGWFREEGSDREVEVVLENGQLALRIPETPTPLGLFSPDDDGARRLRIDPSVEIRFVEVDGIVDAYIASSPVGEARFTRIDEPQAPSE